MTNTAEFKLLTKKFFARLAKKTNWKEEEVKQEFMKAGAEVDEATNTLAKMDELYNLE